MRPGFFEALIHFACFSFLSYVTVVLWTYAINATEFWGHVEWGVPAFIMTAWICVAVWKFMGEPF